MTNDEQRQAVIDEAKSWLRTPHHNGARLKGVGVDCGQFPWAVYNASGLMPKVPEDLRYSPQFHLHCKSDDEWYLKFALQFGKELPEGKMPKRGDFALYKLGRIFSHGAIVITWPLIIHAWVGIGVTIDHGNQGMVGMQRGGKPRAIKFFTLWDD